MNRLRVAYLVNQYPKVSHTFIRREILALESMGVEVHRLSVRGWDNPIADPVDLTEQEKTHYVLKQGVMPLLKSAFQVLQKKPKQFLKALACALKLSRRADRPLPYHLMYLLEACDALLWMQQKQIQHVHAHFGANSTEVALLIRILGGPSYSFTVHGPEEFDKPEFIHLGEKAIHSAFVVAITSYCRSQLYRWVPHSHWKKIQVVHCGLEPDFHQGELPPPSSTPRLVCVGRLCEQKGQLLLVQAAQALQERGIEFELVLAGDGDIRPAIEALIARYGLQSKVRITGWISSSQVREELLQARALVLPSFAEGLPVVIMEAMALKRPVISTYIAGIPELVSHREQGLLVAAGDVEALSNAMVDCLESNAERLAHMGEQAQARVLARHSIDTEVRKLLAHIQHAVETGEEPC